MSKQRHSVIDYDIKDLGNEYPISVHGIHYYDADSHDDAERIVMLHCQLAIALQALEAIKNGATSWYLQDICGVAFDDMPSDRALRMRDVANMALIEITTEILPSKTTRPLTARRRNV